MLFYKNFKFSHVISKSGFINGEFEELMRELPGKEVVCETDDHNSKMNYHPLTKKMRNICSQDICTLFYLVKSVKLSENKNQEPYMKA